MYLPERIHSGEVQIETVFGFLKAESEAINNILNLFVVIFNILRCTYLKLRLLRKEKKLPTGQ